MKNLGIVALVILLSASFTSCEKVKDIFDVDVETTMSGDLDIDIPESALKAAGPYEFDTLVVVDPMDYGDVAENKDRIESITADGIIATVDAVQIGDKNIEDLVLTDVAFTIDNGSISATWTKMEEWPIQVGSKLTLEDIQGIYSEVNEMLTSIDPFTITCKGKSSLKGISITIVVDINCTVTGNLL